MLSRPLSIIAITICLLALLGTADEPAAEEPVSLRVRQARVDLPDILAVVALTEGSGRPATPGSPDHFTATLAGSPLMTTAIENLETSGAGVAYVFAIDVSRSLTSQQFQVLQAAVSNWIDSMEEGDRAAILTFGTDTRVVRDFTGDKASLKEVTGTLAPTDGDTQLHLGLIRALELASRNEQDLPAYRVIVALSDGMDDFVGGPTNDEVLARIRDYPVPVFALGLSKARSTKENEDALKSFGAIARASGGEFVFASPNDLASAYDAARERIRSVHVLKLSCPTCPADGRIQRLDVAWRDGTRSLVDGIDVRLASSKPPPARSVDQLASEPKPDVASIPLPLFAVAGGGAAIVLGGLLYARRRRRPQSAPSAAERDGSAHGLGAEPEIEGVAATAAGETPEGIEIHLVPTKAGLENRNLRGVLVGELVIGRDPRCDLVISDDLEVSAQHCVLVRRQDHVILRDIDSTNGTPLNGVPVLGGHRLEIGDLIVIGRTEFRFSIAREP